jgi:bifunctional non-homologous end joining protein LigD
MHAKSSRFVVHQHKTGRTHFDLRIIHNGVLRSWSLLKAPPCGHGERRLAIERESFTEDSIECKNFEEQAFGMGPVSSWDQGEVEFEEASPRLLVLKFAGAKMRGKYEFRRMRWYPGNRWLLAKLRIPAARQES